MKFSAILAAIVVFSSGAVASLIPAEHQERFLATKSLLTTELDDWLASAAGKYALKNGYVPASATPIASGGLTGTSTSTGSTLTAAQIQVNQLERLYMTKLSILKAKAANPRAMFSTNSPFTLMTDAEFTNFVNRPTGVGGGIGFYSSSTPDVEPDTDTNRRLATSRRTPTPTPKPTPAPTPAPTPPVDWSTSSSCVSPVKNQGACGDCWAFSAIGALESAYCMKTGSLTIFSDQQVTSCDTVSSGCNGGWPLWGLNYLEARGSVCTNASYPFTSGVAGVTGTCTADACTSVPITMSVTNVSATETALVSAIAGRPVAVAVAAGNTQWKQYTSGVLTSCSTSTLDHAVLAVGFTSTYFRLKNQWGTAWGDNGYINLARNGAKSACSIVNTHNVYPVLS